MREVEWPEMHSGDGCPMLGDGGVCGTREREVVVRMGWQWWLSQEYRRGAFLGWRTLICFSVFAFETSAWRCPAGS